MISKKITVRNKILGTSAFLNNVRFTAEEPCPKSVRTGIEVCLICTKPAEKCKGRCKRVGGEMT